MITSVDDTRHLQYRLEDLAAHEAPHSFSILIPTHRTHPETDQDPIRLKNALDVATEALEADGMRSRAVDEVLAPLRQHLSDRSFWQHRDLGLAAFGAPDSEIVEIDVPVSLTPRVHVGDHYMFRPLVAALDEVTVPTLVLSRGGVALYELDGDTALRVACDLPASMDDVNWFVDRESRLQHRPQPPGGDGGGFHGHDPEEDEDEDLRRYLVAVAQEIEPRLSERDIPLVVAAPGNLAAHIGAIIDHPVVPHAAVEPADDEHAVARAVRDTRRELLDQRRAALRADLSERAGRGETIETLEEALESAAIGRVGSLAVVPDADPVWGTFDVSSLELVRHDERQAGDDDLADRLVALTIHRGGEVRPIDEPIDDHWFVAVPRFDVPRR